MKILLRILIVLMLILSGVALYLGIALFNQREQLKARVNVLEDFDVKLADFIETEQAGDLAVRDLPKGGLQKRDLKKYFLIGPDGKPTTRIDPVTGKKVKIAEGQGTMRYTLDAFLTRVQKQYQRLDATRLDLSDTRETLRKTRDELSTTKASLEAARADIDERKAQIEDLKSEVSQHLVTIDTKDQQIADLNSQIKERDENIAKLEEKRIDLENHITAQKKRITDLQHEIERLKNEKAKESSTILPGSKGTVMKVTPEWNLVIIAIAPNSGLSRDVTLIVQRENKFVGKLRVLEVKEEENVAIADVLDDWLQMPIQKGDRVTY